MMEHFLKTWPRYFRDLRNQTLTFCMRRNDRGYAVGDVLHLREFVPETSEFTGETELRRVTYVMPGGEHGIHPDYVVLGLEIV